MCRYYSRYNLYQYIFSKREVSIVRQTLPSEVELPTSFPPLSTAFELAVPPAEDPEQHLEEE